MLVRRSVPSLIAAVRIRKIWNISKLHDPISFKCKRPSVFPAKFITRIHGGAVVRNSRYASTSVQIGDCELLVEPPKNPELVPLGYGLGDLEDQETLGHLRWMLQKFALGQDVFLLGGPGPRRRRLALHICELAGLEVEYVRITRDTTEADLKQRRDILGKSPFEGQCRYPNH